MKKLLLTLLLIVSVTQILFAQVTTGCFRIGGSNFETAKAIVETYDGNYVIGGATTTFSSGTYDGNFYVVKTDPTGNVLWSHSEGDGFGDECFDLIETSDHSIVGAGVAGTGTMLVVKYDENGNLQWLKAINLLIMEQALAVVETEDGGVVIAGRYENVFFPFLSLLIKLDSDGNKVWEKTFRNQDNPFSNATVSYVVVRTVENHYIVGGYYPFGGLFSGLVAFDKDGNYLWAKQSTVGGIIYGLVATSDSGFVTSGFSRFSTWDAQLCKFDKEGNLEWSRAYGDSLNDVFNSVDVTDDGGLIAAGAAINFVNPTYCYIMKTDALGNEEWSHILGDHLNYYEFLDVHQTLDGGYVAAGLYYEDMWVAKFDENGNICADCWPGDYGSELQGTDFTNVTMAFEPDTGVVDAPVFDQYTGGDLTVICLETGVETLNENFSLRVFPNPSSSGIFQFRLPSPTNAIIVVYDVFGRKIFEKKMTQEENEVDITSYPKGIYFLEIRNEMQRFPSKLIYE